MFLMFHPTSFLLRLSNCQEVASEQDVFVTLADIFREADPSVVMGYARILANHHMSLLTPLWASTDIYWLSLMRPKVRRLSPCRGAHFALKLRHGATPKGKLWASRSCAHSVVEIAPPRRLGPVHILRPAYAGLSVAQCGTDAHVLFVHLLGPCPH